MLGDTGAVLSELQSINEVAATLNQADREKDRLLSHLKHQLEVSDNLCWVIFSG